MKKKSVWMLLTATIAFTLALSGQARAVPTNGNFDSGLAGWEYSGEVREGDEGGFAFLTESIIGDRISSLWQDFTMPDNAQNLTFKLILDYTGGPPASDKFSVSLISEFENKELYSIDIHEGNGAGEIVTLDVSLFSKEDVRLMFALYSDPCDIGSTSISLDDIVISSSTSTIPAPGALLMAVIGTTLAGWFCRSKTFC